MHNPSVVSTIQRYLDERLSLAAMRLSMRGAHISLNGSSPQSRLVERALDLADAACEGEITEVELRSELRWLLDLTRISVL